MKPHIKKNKYKNCIALTIKTIRILKGVKETTVAGALCINRSNYCRKENGITEITIGELHVISETINTSVFEIFITAEFWIKDYHLQQINHTDLLNEFLNTVFIRINYKVNCPKAKMEIDKVKRILLKSLKKLDVL